VAEYTLYCFAQSGNAYKAARTLDLCGADCQPRFVDHFNGETRTPADREPVNEMGEVPVLERDGRRLAQSGVILDDIACTFGKFGGSNEDERREILRWLLWDDHKLTSYIATLRYFLQFARDPDPGAVAFLKGRVAGALGILDKRLAAQPFAVGERLTIADLSMCGYLYWPDEFGVSWQDYAHIGAWLERIRAQPGWVHPYTLMPGHPLPAASGKP